MSRTLVVIHRDHIKPPLRRLGGLLCRDRSQVIANNDLQVAPLLAIHCSFRRFNGASRTRLHLDEAQYVFIPSDQINLTMMPRRTVVPRDHHVSTLAEIKVGGLLATTAGAEVGRSRLSVRRFRGYPI